jgi:hypothetical protein
MNAMTSLPSGAADPGSLMLTEAQYDSLPDRVRKLIEVIAMGETGRPAELSSADQKAPVFDVRQRSLLRAPSCRSGSTRADRTVEPEFLDLRQPWLYSP